MPTLSDPAFGQLYDPFIGDQVQSNRLRAYCAIVVNGLNVTHKLDPHLIQVRAMTGMNVADYQAEIELDDRDGRLPIPPLDSSLKIFFGWVGESSTNMLVWDGVVHDVEHGFGRKQGGRRMWIHGRGAEQFRGGKEQKNRSWGEGAKEGEQGETLPVSKVLKEAAQKAGHTIEVHSFFDGKNLQRDYWQQAGEPYYHFATRLAKEMGALFRVKGGTNGEFTQNFQNVDGTFTPSVEAVWGKNLIGWRLRPLSAASMWKEASQHFFDVGAGKWNEVAQQVTQNAPFNLGTSKFRLPVPAPNKQQAGGDNEGVDESLGQEQGTGRIVINGEPTAQGNCAVQIVGARPGVDGVYWCKVAEHIYSRQGYITWLDVQAVQLTGMDGVSPPYTMNEKFLQKEFPGGVPLPPTPPVFGNVP